MKYIYAFFLIAFVMTSYGQRLYLHDMENGNYKSYDIGEKISFVLFESSTTLSGTITGFQQDGVIMNDTTFVKLTQIAGVLKTNGGASVGRVLLIILGSYMMVTGALTTISGIALIATGESGGLLVASLGAGIGIGGFAIVNTQAKKIRNKGNVLKNNDNINYRLLIE